MNVLPGVSNPTSITEWAMLPLGWLGSLTVRSSLLWDLLTDVFFANTAQPPV